MARTDNIAPDHEALGTALPEVSHEPYDSRRAANLLLHEANRVGIDITHLALHKLLYLSHGLSLIENGRPFVSGYFEAWRYGPVHPAVYSAFKEAGEAPIGFKARGQDALTGEHMDLPEIDSPSARLLVQRVLTGYGRLSSGRIVEIAHARDGPWDFVVKKSRASVVFGMRIPDDVILQRFRYHHIVPVNNTPLMGDPREDTPIAQD